MKNKMSKIIGNDETVVYDKDAIKADGLWQPQVIYKINIKKGLLKTESLPFPFVCNKVFVDSKEATMYLSVFIKDLIKDGSLPENAIVKDKDKDKFKVNEDVIAPGLLKLTFAAIDLPDKKTD